jgi:hypothetical protein
MLKKKSEIKIDKKDFKKIEGTEIFKLASHLKILELE